MLYIPCPYCGARDETEFTYGGPSHVTRPALSSTDREWTRYLYHRANTKGLHHVSAGFYSYGCGRWFNVLRDTTTHDILDVYLMGVSADSSELGALMGEYPGYITRTHGRRPQHSSGSSGGGR